MTRRSGLLSVAVAVAVGAGLGVVAERAGLLGGHADGGSAAGGERPAARGPRVQVAVAAAGELRVPIEMLGAVTRVPGSMQSRSLRVDVVVVRVLATPGARVEADTPVLEVRPTPEADGRLRAAEAAVSAARAQLEAVRARVDARLGTRSEALQVEQALRGQELELDVLRASAPPADGLLPAGAAGTLSTGAAAVGAVVPAGTPLFEVASDEAVAARFGIPLADADEVPVGTELELVELLSGGRHTAGARVERIEAELESSSRTLVGWTERIDPALWRPGTPVRVTAQVTSPTGLLVPRGAVVLSDDGPVLFRLEDGVARRRVIRVLAGTAETVCVRADGLAAGDPVVVLGGHELEDGAVVQVEGEP